MAHFEEWELYNAPYVGTDGDVRVIARKWEPHSISNAYVFIDEIREELNKISIEQRMEASLEFRTWEDREGCDVGSVTLSYHRPATQKEILMDRAKHRKSVTDDRSWIENRIGALIKEAEDAGLSAADIGIAVVDGAYTITRSAEAKQE